MNIEYWRPLQAQFCKQIISEDIVVVYIRYIQTLVKDHLGKETTLLYRPFRATCSAFLIPQGAASATQYKDHLTVKTTLVRI